MSFLLRQYKVLGVIFVVFIVVAVYLTYATFTKKFATYDEVTVKSSTIGLQLPNRADVKIRGVQVGEVLSTSADAEGATIKVGLYPAEVDTIPSNVTASIVPKTLFGEKYVSLIVPDDASQQHIEAGATIDKTRVSTEVEKVLSDLYPLLRTVQPAQLNMTLNAIATALEGRGDQLGQSLETVDAYLTRLNPEIPALVEDLRLTAQVSDVYSDVLPQVGDILQNTVTTTTTLETREAKLNALLNDVSDFSDTARTFLDDNEDNIIRVGQLGSAQLDVLARYSTEFPCLLGGLVNGGKRQAEAFRNYTLHIVLETLPNQPRSYTPADTPQLGEDRGPNCLHLPNPPWSQDNPVTRLPDFADGVNSPTGKGTQRVATDYGRAYAGTQDGSGSAAQDSQASAAEAPATQLGGFGGYAGSPQENDLIAQLLAPGLGTDPASVPDLGALLLGPAVRGATVGYDAPGVSP